MALKMVEVCAVKKKEVNIHKVFVYELKIKQSDDTR